MKKEFYSVKENQESADIYIYGIIGYDESYWGEGTNNVAYPFITLIKNLEKKYNRINIHINSPGGIIDDGLAIFNTIRNSISEIHTYNDGITASMASIIMLAGHVKHFNSSSIFHLHSPLTMTIGNKKDHEESIKQLNTYQAVLIDAIKKTTNLSEEEISTKWFDGEDHFMTAEEANEFGFVDDLLDKATKNQFKAAASLTYQDIYDSFKKKTFSEKIQNLFNTNNIKQTSNNLQNQIEMNNSFKKLNAFLFVDALTENSDGKIVFDQAQVSRIENEMTRLQSVENSLIDAKANIKNLEKENQDLKADKESQDAILTKKDNELNSLKETNSALESKNVELTEKIEKTPADQSSNFKSNEPVSDNVNWELINNLPHNKDCDNYFNNK